MAVPGRPKPPTSSQFIVVRLLLWQDSTSWSTRPLHGCQMHVALLLPLAGCRRSAPKKTAVVPDAARCAAAHLSGTISLSAVPPAAACVRSGALRAAAGCRARRALVEHPSLAWPRVDVIAATATARCVWTPAEVAHSGHEAMPGLAYLCPL